MKITPRIVFGLLGLFSFALILAGCAAPAPVAAEPALSRTEFSLPEGITFQLPEGYDWAGNAGWLSPDGGTSWIGLRQAWVQEGLTLAENSRYLHNEDVEILSEGTQTFGEIETAVVTLKSYLTVAATGERKFVGYERIWAFPAPDGEVLAGVFTQAQSEEELDAMDEAARVMIESLAWAE